MDSRDKLHKFMEAKAKKIYRLTGHSKTLYYGAGDKVHIYAFSEKEARSIWEEICGLTDHLTKDGFIRINGYGLSAGVCPFCIKYFSDFCEQCPYKILHKKCDNFASTYVDIWNIATFQSIDLKKAFSIQYYQKLINRINGE